MKILYNLKHLFIIVIAMLFNSCSDDFLNTENKNEVTSANFFSKEKDVEYAVNTAYTPLAHRGLFGLNYFVLFNSFDDRILFETSNLDEMKINSSSGEVDQMWGDLYLGLFRTSDIIKNLNERTVPGLTDEKKGGYIAQLKALRGMYYFYLVTLFNKPIYYDETSIPTDTKVKFSNGEPEQFWNKMVEDLEYAAPLLPVTWTGDNKGRITQGAAYALLGKAMLFKHYNYYVVKGQDGTVEDLADLDKAKKAFEKVQTLGYELSQPKNTSDSAAYVNAMLCNFSYLDIPSVDGSYESENNKESVWEVQYNDERWAAGWLPGWQWSGSLLYHYFSPNKNSYKNQEIHPSLWSQFEVLAAGVHPAGLKRDPRAYATCYLDGDLMDFRQNDYYVPYTTGKNNKAIASSRVNPKPVAVYPLTKSFGLKKYYYPQYLDNKSPDVFPNNVRVIRYADVLLMYAEVEFLLGNTTGPGLNALNEVRARSGMPAIAELTTAAIIHERDVELATEGHRFLDLVRWQRDPQWGIDFVALKFTSFVPGKSEYLPIPVAEINKNLGYLLQNPGW